MYHLVIYPEAQDQIAALPHEVLTAYAEILDVVQLTPWNGQPQHQDHPEAAVRRWTFGADAAGQIIYLILEDQREVHVLLVQWLG